VASETTSASVPPDGEIASRVGMALRAGGLGSVEEAAGLLDLAEALADRDEMGRVHAASIAAGLDQGDMGMEFPTEGVAAVPAGQIGEPVDERAGTVDGEHRLAGATQWPSPDPAAALGRVPAEVLEDAQGLAFGHGRKSIRRIPGAGTGRSSGT